MGALAPIIVLYLPIRGWDVSALRALILLPIKGGCCTIMAALAAILVLYRAVKGSYIRAQRALMWLCSLKELNLYFKIMNVKLCLLNQEIAVICEGDLVVVDVGG